MDTATSTFTQEFAAVEPPKRFLEPFVEARDHANQWDVSALWRAPALREEMEETGQSPPRLTSQST